MKKILLLLLLTLTGCASFQVSTLNHDSVRVVNNEFELQRLLRTDFNFRYDFAQYALRQPRSFDWNNRVLGNRYSFYNPYYSRTQMWNDWLWGFNGWNSWGSPHRWSPFGYDRWGYGIYYGWNNHGWNYNYYGWNNWNTWNNHLNPNWGRSYVNNNRKNTTIIRDRRAHASMIQSTKRTRVVTNKPRIRTKPRINYNTKPVIINRRPPSNNNSRPIFNNSRPVINNNSRPNNNNKTRGNSNRKN